MKNTIIILGIAASFFINPIQAQNRTTVNAMSNEISDNLDLRAVASIFGDSRNLEDFERRLNDPEIQISNLDLNNDNEVDYLRVIETVDRNTHLVIIQSVLDRDVYQDVASIDIERSNNRVQVQFIGNEYLYGPNYIYEPVYYATPQIYASFWISNYRPYISNWYWNFYPSYYYAWNPYPVYRYRSNINLCLNFSNRYNYVNYRRSSIAVSLYSTRRSNAYERRYPNYAFTRRYSNYSNRYELDQRRNYSRNYSSNSAGVGRQYNYNNNSTRREPQRDYSSNRNNSSRVYSNPRSNTKDFNNNNSNSSNSRQYTPSRGYSQNNNNNSRINSSEKAPSRDYNQNQGQHSRFGSNTPNQNQRQYTPRQENSTPRVENNRGNSSNRGSYSRPESAAPQRSEAGRSRSFNRGENNGSERGNTRRI
ncbi:hypothetical protein [Flavobacterium flavipallidum]|uniref:DUF3300 domain-containing protein n=1 Tax=Flavobacterium flavipallidum TaxID=3139140 RepID=A0ABU9HQA6_9FLAO